MIFCGHCNCFYTFDELNTFWLFNPSYIYVFYVFQVVITKTNGANYNVNVCNVKTFDVSKNTQVTIWYPFYSKMLKRYITSLKALQYEHINDISLNVSSDPVTHIIDIKKQLNDLTYKMFYKNNLLKKTFLKQQIQIYNTFEY